MHYDVVVPGMFQDRPNRFIAHVEIDGVIQTVHVKNTGRCRELLLPGAAVYCSYSNAPARKTQYDLIAVQKGGRLVNMDSQAPNAAAGEWLRNGGLGEISDLRAEVVHGDSRFDFAFQKDGKQCFLEVKGCTLEEDGVCSFPDAPTERGRKHLYGLAGAAMEGYGAWVLFVIQMKGVRFIRPHWETDPDFARALIHAKEAGVHIMAVDCKVTPSEMKICDEVEVHLEAPEIALKND